MQQGPNSPLLLLFCSSPPPLNGFRTALAYPLPRIPGWFGPDRLAPPTNPKSRKKKTCTVLGPSRDVSHISCRALGYDLSNSKPRNSEIRQTPIHIKHTYKLSRSHHHCPPRLAVLPIIHVQHSAWQPSSPPSTQMAHRFIDLWLDIYSWPALSCPLLLIILIGRQKKLPRLHFLPICYLTTNMDSKMFIFFQLINHRRRSSLPWILKKYSLFL